MDLKNPELALRELIAPLRYDPVKFCDIAYEWGKGELASSNGLRGWQRDIANTVGKHLQNPSTRYTPLRIAVASGHGIGKSCIVSMLTDWALSTCVDTKIVITANTENQLRTKTMPEVSKWVRNSINAHWFTTTATAVISTEESRTSTWRADAIPWSENNTDAFAGLHNEGKRLILIFDEASSISDKVWEVAEGAMTDANTEIIWLAFGNPTQNTGRFRECFGKYKHRWVTKQIDSRTVEGTNKEQIQTWIEDYGEDSDFVRIRVKGEFPRMGDMQFISQDVVAEARRREAYAKLDDPFVMGVDIARFGCFDEETEILTNSGWKYFPDLSGKEKVLTLNGDNSEWGKIDQVHKYPFDGKLNLYESSKANFCVTDNHKFLVRSHQRSNNYALKTYEDLPEHYMVRAWNGWNGNAIKEKAFETVNIMPHGGKRIKRWAFSGNDWASFMGWFLSEGNVYTETRKDPRYRILIAQNPGAKSDIIKNLLTRMKIKYRMTPNKKQFEFTSQSIGVHLLKECGHGASNKRIPQYIKDSSPEQIRLFLDAFLLGDGTRRKDNNGRAYFSSSKGMIDDLQEILVKIGCAGSIALRMLAGSEFFIDGRRIVRHHDTYVLYERNSSSRKGAAHQYRDKFLKKSTAKKIAYKGFVWCVSTKYKIIYVRRKGVPMWSGNSDQSIICFRRGRDARSIPWIKMRGADTMTVAAKIAELYNYHQPDAIFVDGGGVGGGVIDRLNMLRLPVIEVQFGGSADRSIANMEGAVKYANKRAEMWGNMREWLKGGAIPDEPELEQDLVGVQYGYKIQEGKDVIILESKKDMKRRGLSSPDMGDALCLVGETLIATPNGDRRIDSLQVGDEVITPLGKTRIAVKWHNKIDRLTTARFSNGSSLSGKGEHKIFVWKHGQCRLDALSLTDEIATIEQIRLWRLISLFTKMLNIQFKPLVDTIRAERSVTALAFFTVIPGLIISELYQKIMMFITRMRIGAITIHRILRPSLCQSTGASIYSNELPMGKWDRQQNMPWPAPQSGMPHLKESHGIEGMQKNNGRTQKQKLSNANVAATIMKPIWVIRNIALLPALKKLATGVILQRQGNAHGAAKNFLLTAIGRWDAVPVCAATKGVEQKKKLSGIKYAALSAAYFFKRQLGVQIKNVVPENVLTVNVTPTDVYNLTLEKHNTYYANGILVYNCLTLAYPVQPSDHRNAIESRGRQVHKMDYDPLALEYVKGQSGVDTRSDRPIALDYMRGKW